MIVSILTEIQIIIIILIVSIITNIIIKILIIPIHIKHWPIHCEIRPSSWKRDAAARTETTSLGSIVTSSFNKDQFSDNLLQNNILPDVDPPLNAGFISSFFDQS